MNQICCIMDVDGFSPRIWREDKRTYQTPFLIRELGYVKIDSTQRFPPKSFRFDLRDQIDSRSADDNEKTLTHQSGINGMSLFPGREETGVLPYDRLQDVVRNMYEDCRTPGATLVAYKGGQNESTLLECLGIPCVDLQVYGCPKYDRLARSGKVIRDCGHHRLTEARPVHCPMAEVVAYRDWCDRNMKKFDVGTTPGGGTTGWDPDDWSDDDSD